MNLRHINRLFAAAALSLLAGCTGENKPAEQASAAPAPAAPAAAVSLNGTGASFPAPVYQSWTYTYSQARGPKVSYQSVGSGAGLNQIKEGTIDFAGSDNPLTTEQLTNAGLAQLPMLTGGVVVIVNLPGVADGQLRLSRENLADLFLGKITKWNDARIAAANPGLALPDLAVTVVHRADASGTSFIFTNYLTKISPEWKEKVGCGSSVKWPVGIGGQKNPGVCNSVAKVSGSIGYTEYTYAVEAKLAMAQLPSQKGTFLKPSIETFSACVANADWLGAPSFYLVLTDQPGDNSWPITGVTYILFRKDAAPEKKQALFQYLNWCLDEGPASARQLNYVPLPKNVAELIKKNVLK